MRRALRIGGGIALVLIVALFGVFLSGQRGFPVPPRAEFQIDLQALRALAHARSGAAPAALNALIVSRGQLPHGAIVAGKSWFELVPRVFPAYQIAYADGSSIVVDAPLFGSAGPDTEPALRALEDAIGRSSSLLLTHSHGDHVLGLAQSARYAELRGKLVATRALFDEPNFGLRVFPEKSLSGVAPLEYQGSYAFAPGVVLLAAPGHTRDSQMIFVQLADAREYLIVGDVVWDMENVRSLTTRPRIVANTLIHGDEAKVADQVRALHDLLEREPALELVISHDARHLEEQVQGGKIGSGFSS